MVALNFQKQFAALVESGAKRQTIRHPRKIPFKVDDPLQLYTGMRTKNCRKLGEAKCTAVKKILLTCTSIERLVIIDGDVLGIGGKHTFARADGFANIIEMFDWFEKTHGLPFDGVLIKWRP